MLGQNWLVEKKLVERNGPWLNTLGELAETMQRFQTTGIHLGQPDEMIRWFDELDWVTHIEVSGPQSRFFAKTTAVPAAVQYEPISAFSNGVVETQYYYMRAYCIHLTNGDSIVLLRPWPFAWSEYSYNPSQMRVFATTNASDEHIMLAITHFANKVEEFLQEKKVLSL